MFVLLHAPSGVFACNIATAQKIRYIATVWLPTMAAIAPTHLQRQELTQNTHLQLKNLPNNFSIKKIIETATNTARLKSRKPFYKTLKTTF